MTVSRLIAYIISNTLSYVTIQYMKQNWRDIPSMTQRPPMKKINKFGTPSTTSNTTKQQPSTTATISCAFSNGNVQVYDQSTLLPIESYRPQPQCTNHVNSHHFLVTVGVWNMDQPHPPAPYLPQEMMVVSSRKICVNHPMSWRKVSISVPCAKVTIRMKRCYHFPLDMMDRL